jgi:hypothetical protein
VEDGEHYGSAYLTHTEKQKIAHKANRVIQTGELERYGPESWAWSDDDGIMSMSVPWLTHLLYGYDEYLARYRRLLIETKFTTTSSSDPAVHTGLLPSSTYILGVAMDVA